MFFKIIKKDLKRKKSMNMILFVFILTASILIAGSSNLLYSTVTALNYFMNYSKVTDLIVLANSDQATTKTIRDWSKTCKMVKSLRSENAVIVNEKDITSASGKALRDTNYLALMEKPIKYNLIFDQQGKDFHIGPSEIAIPVSIHKKMGLSIGDSLVIKVSGYQKKLKITHIFKDVVLGSELMGMKRIIINEEDYQKYFNHTKAADHLKFWGFMKKNHVDIRSLDNNFSNLSLPTFTVMTKDTVKTTYVMDLILAALMIIVSIFLILISFLILRFTIVFTIMEDYKQIGVMKAIGLKNKSIRGMYSVKYLTLSVIAGIIGYIISIPVSEVMKKNISDYILMNQTGIVYLIGFISVLFVILIIMLFCNYSTGKINKVSAIEAIRQGNSGERFKNTGKLNLNHHKKIGIPLFLALSDIKSDFKKFIILIITFILGTAIIIIPSNCIATLCSENTIPLFGQIKSDFYIGDLLFGNKDKAEGQMQKYTKMFKDKGIDAKLRAELFTSGKVFTIDQSNSIQVLCYQGVRTNTDRYDYLKGTPPKLNNEIAITEKTARYLNIGIGDHIYCDIQGVKKKFIVTALYQTYNNMGNSVRMSEDYNLIKGSNTSIQIAGNFTGSANVKAKKFSRLKRDFPKLMIKNSKELLKSYIGGIADQMRKVNRLILFIVLGINFLITALLLRMLISKEIPEIAILKSLGFPNTSIRLWQIFRIGIILLVSIMTGTVLANTTGSLITGGIFQIMGVTRLHLSVQPFYVYFLYPVLLFGVTMTAVLLSIGQIKKTHVWELNNQE